MARGIGFFYGGMVARIAYILSQSYENAPHIQIAIILMGLVVCVSLIIDKAWPVLPFSLRKSVRIPFYIILFALLATWLAVDDALFRMHRH